MANPLHLSKAPIVEAVLDFQVKLPNDFTAAQLLDLKSEFQDRYPTVKETRLFETLIKFEYGKGISHEDANQGLQGLQFWSPNNLSVAHFRGDGFSFSKLQPYTSWEEVSKEAMRMWEAYVEALRPELIRRLAVRYINRWTVPTNTKLTRHLQEPPRLPAELQSQNVIRTFLTRIVAHDPSQNINANIIQASEPGPEPLLTTLLLDIDVYKEREFEVKSNAIAETFEALRSMKNRIFFSSITDETVQMFL